MLKTKARKLSLSDKKALYAKVEYNLRNLEELSKDFAKAKDFADWNPADDAIEELTEVQAALEFAIAGKD